MRACLDDDQTAVETLVLVAKVNLLGVMVESGLVGHGDRLGEKECKAG